MKPAAVTTTTAPTRVGLLLAAAAVWLLLCMSLAYVPDIGRGFIADDFGWLRHSQVRAPRDVLALFAGAPMGFYRPLVSLSFSAGYALFGLWPMGHALTNLALALGTSAAIYHLVRGMGFAPAAGLFAAALWLFNIHGVGMALTWISGRTSLLTTLFAVLAANAFVRRRTLTAGLWALAALLSKEEPIMLPMILLLWTLVDDRRRGTRLEALGRALGASWPCFVAVVVYLALRQTTPAFTPGSAPDVYRLSLSPGILVINALEYTDRSLTFTVAVLAIGLLLFARRTPRPDAHERVVALKGALWFVLGWAIVVLVPVRSDLYACFPSVGASLMGAAIGTSLWRLVPHSRRRLATASMLVLPLALAPVYWGRNVFAKNDARLSARLVALATRELETQPDVTTVEIVQAPKEMPSARAALGAALPHAIWLTMGRTIDARILDLPADALPPVSNHQTLRLVVQRGEVERR